MNKNNEKSNIRDLIKGMVDCFNPEAVGNLQGDIQFIFTNEDKKMEKEKYFLRVLGNNCIFNKGSSSSPALVITSPPGIWEKISSGELDGSAAFLSGKYKVKGDMRFLMKMDKIFSDS